MNTEELLIETIPDDMEAFYDEIIKEVNENNQQTFILVTIDENDMPMQALLTRAVGFYSAIMKVKIMGIDRPHDIKGYLVILEKAPDELFDKWLSLDYFSGIDFNNTESVNIH